MAERIPSEQFPKVHRQEIFCMNTTFTHDEGRAGLEPLPEHIKAFGALLGIALDLNGNDRPFLAQDEVHFVVAVTPVEHLEAMDKGLAYQPVGSSSLFLITWYSALLYMFLQFTQWHEYFYSGAKVQHLSLIPKINLPNLRRGAAIW